MSRTETVTLYQFSELSDRAKERARDWYREGALYHDWWDFTFNDATEIAKILGIEIATVSRSVGGTTRTQTEHCIYFSGFASQGDGACFEGQYEYAKGAPKAIRAYAGQDTELHRIADSLQSIQRRHFYRLTATIKHSGYYSHEFCTDIDVCNSHTGDSVDADTTDSIASEMRAFMRWIYKRLEAEHDYLMSDEAVDESIECNEYEFHEDGSRA
jgi:hypothetical protein